VSVVHVVAIFAFIFSGMWALLSPDPAMVRQLRRTVHRGESPAADEAQREPSRTPRERIASALEAMILRRSLVQSLEARLRAADLELRVGEFLLLSLGLGVLGLLLALLLGGGVLLLLAPMLLALPTLFLGTRSQERRKQIGLALPDALGSTASALRAGFSLLQALDACARQTKGPLGQELDRMLAETRVGVPVDEALENLAKRAGSPDLTLMVTAVQIQRQVGGNLAEVLDRIQQTIRERIRLQAEVRALSAQGRMSSMIIGLLPIGLLVLMAMLAPAFVGPMLQPGIGRMLLILAGLFEIAGFFVLSRVVRIEV
jgi:tight adherence protein B